MGARPYRLCSAAALAGAQLHATQALQRWSSEWLGPTAGQIAVEVSEHARTPAAANEGDWLRAHGDKATFWVATSQQALLGQLLFGPSAGAARPGTLAASSVAQALEALVQELAGARSFQHTAAPVHLHEAGRAAVQMMLRWGDESLLLLGELAPTARPVSASPKSPLGSLAQALGAQPVTLRAGLGSTELDLQTLQMLRVGDVLPLDKRVDDRLDLSVAGEELHCAGYLVSLDGAKAIEFTRQPIRH